MTEGDAEAPKEAAVNVPASVEPAEVEGAVRKILEQDLTPAEARRVAPKVVAVTASLWKAPIPPPSILEGYESIVPGSAKDIIQAFTSEVSNRQRLQRWGVGIQGAGLACGVIVVLCMLGLAAYALYGGHTAVAAGIPVALAGVAGVFVLRQSPSKKQGPTNAPRQLSRAERRNLERQNRRGGN